MDTPETSAAPERLVDRRLISRLKLYMAATYVIAVLMGAIKAGLSENLPMLFMFPIIGVYITVIVHPWITVGLFLLVGVVWRYGLARNNAVLSSIGTILLALVWLGTVYWALGQVHL